MSDESVYVTSIFEFHKLFWKSPSSIIIIVSGTFEALNEDDIVDLDKEECGALPLPPLQGMWAEDAFGSVLVVLISKIDYHFRF